MPRFPTPPEPGGSSRRSFLRGVAGVVAGAGAFTALGPGAAASAAVPTVAEVHS